MLPASRPAGTTTSSSTATCDVELDISATCVVNGDTTTTKKYATGNFIETNPGRAGRIDRRNEEMGGAERPGRVVPRGRMAGREEWMACAWCAPAGLPSRATSATGWRQRNRERTRQDPPARSLFRSFALSLFRSFALSLFRSFARSCVRAFVQRVSSNSTRRHAGAAVPAKPATAGAVQRTSWDSHVNTGRRHADAAPITPPPRSPDATRAAHTHPAAPSVPHDARPR